MLSLGKPVRLLSQRPDALLGAILLAGTLASCGPTYPKDRVEPAIVDLCQREFQLTVQARLLGGTVGVRLDAHNFFESPVTVTPDMDPQALNQQLRFSPEGVEQLQHVALVVRRVVFSTDAQIKFYQVIVRDADGGQIELHWIGHVLDLKRFNAMDISQGEFLRYRSVIFFRVIADRSARRVVEQLFEDLRNRAPVATISRHFSPRADANAILPFLIQNLVPSSRPGEGAISSPP